jgi:hypothetical protein
LLESGEVDVAALQEIKVFAREIVPNDAHKVHRGKEAGSHGGVAGRASEKVCMFFKRGFDGVECDGSNYEYRHGDGVV